MRGKQKDSGSANETFEDMLRELGWVRSTIQWHEPKWGWQVWGCVEDSRSFAMLRAIYQRGVEAGRREG